MKETSLSVTETAKLVRKALKKNFPAVKFSVRSSSYSGGASVHVYWTDGPCTNRVNKVLNLFEGAEFDGMQDLKSYKDALVSNADGSIEKVHYGADYVIPSRDVSNYETRKEEALNYINANCAVEGNRFGNCWVEELASNLVRERDYEKETLEQAFKRIVCHETSEIPS